MITAIGDVMREAYSRRWITTRDGNCSMRQRGRDILYITPTGTRKTTIIPETVVRLPIFESKLVLGDKKPSGELEMHWLLQQEDRTRCVLHLHPTHIVAAMMAGFDLHDVAKEFPEAYRYTRVGHNVPKLPAVSTELASSTYFQMTDPLGAMTCDVIGQANHGATAVGKHPWDAFEHIERLEHICEIFLKSR